MLPHEYPPPYFTAVRQLTLLFISYTFSFFMKTSFLFCAFFAAMLFGGPVTHAQTGRIAPKPRVAPKPRMTAATGVGLKDGLTMQKGRVVLTELGITNPLTADKKLINGTTISAAGIVTATDGTTTQMTEGDMVSLTGRVTTRTSIVEADSLLKIKTYDLRYPGKRKKAEAERERREKEKAKAEARKAKAKKK